MNKKVIINADDFGYTPAVTFGIIEAFNKGIVSSTTALTVSPFFKEAMKHRDAIAPALPVGLHLTLTLNQGTPLIGQTRGTSFLKEDGTFLHRRTLEERLQNGEIDLSAVADEWEAQFLAFLDSGHLPTHLDSHHHIHRLDGLFEIAVGLAKKYNLPMRAVAKTDDAVRFPSRTYVDFYDSGVSLDTLAFIFNDIATAETVVIGELSVHPSFVENRLSALTEYATPRLKELDLLTSTEAKNLLKSSHLILTDFRAV